MGAAVGVVGCSSSDEPAPLILVVTDVSLKGLAKELVPLGLPLLVQFDLPHKKVSKLVAADLFIDVRRSDESPHFMTTCTCG